MTKPITGSGTDVNALLDEIGRLRALVGRWSGKCECRCAACMELSSVVIDGERPADGPSVTNQLLQRLRRAQEFAAMGMEPMLTPSYKECADEIERLMARVSALLLANVGLAERATVEPKPLPDFTAGLIGESFTPELEAEFKRRVEAAGYVYGGISKPGDAL